MKSVSSIATGGMNSLAIYHGETDVLQIIQSITVNDDRTTTVTTVFMTLTFLAIIAINVPIIR